MPKVLRYFIFARLELWYNIGEMNNKKIVLVVGMVTSPAVMTETVWALAYQERQVTGTY